MNMTLNMTSLLALALALAGCGGDGGGDVTDALLEDRAAQATVQQILPGTDVEDEAVYLAGLVEAPVGVTVAHRLWAPGVTIPGLSTVVVPRPQTEITHYGSARAFLTAAQLTDLFGASEVAQAFPPGDGDPLTIRANQPEAMPEGDYFVLHMSTQRSVIDPNSFLEGTIYQYAFVFDADGITTNNFKDADTQDYFNDSDRWYVLEFTTLNGWKLTVKTATTDSEGVHDINEVASAARVIFTSNAIVLIVPQAEFTDTSPSFRCTTFCYNAVNGFDQDPWSGDTEPTTFLGLKDMPAE
jgi:hypothetical protein